MNEPSASHSSEPAEPALCKHENAILTGQGSQDDGDGVITMLWSFWCDDCKTAWTESAPYTTERYYGIDE